MKNQFLKLKISIKILYQEQQGLKLVQIVLERKIDWLIVLIFQVNHRVCQ